MNKLSIVVAICAVVVTVIIVSKTIYAKYAQPRIVLSRDVVDFGELDPSQRVVMSVAIENHGRADLRIENVHISCGCTTTSLDKKVIPPQGKADLRIELTALGNGRNKSLDMLIISNDPKTPKKLAKLKYGIKRDSPLSGKQIYFGRVRRDQLPQTRSIFFFCNESEKRRFLENGGVDVDAPFLKVDSPVVSNDQGFSIVVTLLKDVPSGEILSDVFVWEGNAAKSKEHVFEVIGYVRGEVTATPSLVYLTPPKEEVVTIQSREDGENIELLGVDLPGNLADRVSVEPKGNGHAAKVQQLKVRLKHDMVASRGTWLLGQILAKVRFGEKTETLAIPVVCKKEQ